MFFTGNMFNLAEKNKLETLHAALPLTRGDIVKARYLFLVCVLVIVLFPLLLMKLLFFPNNEKIYFYIAVAFLTTSFLTSLTYPFCFKIGVAKMQGVFSLFFVLFFVTILRSPELRGRLSDVLSILTTSPVRTIAAGLILLYLSYLLSLKIYRTKDL